MSALDKLNAKAKEKQNIQMPAGEKKDEAESANIRKMEKKAQTAETRQKGTAKKVATKTKTGKHAGGRPNTRGNYKMVNIALPLEVYDKVKEVCNGNMTFFLNSVIRESVGM